MSGTSAICGIITQTTNKINVVRSASAKIYHTHWRSFSSDSIARYSQAGYKNAAPSHLLNQTKPLLGNYSLVVSVIQLNYVKSVHKLCERKMCVNSSSVTSRTVCVLDADLLILLRCGCARTCFLLARCRFHIDTNALKGNRR